MPDAPPLADEGLDEIAPETGESPPAISISHGLWALLLSAAVMVTIGYFTYDAEVFRQLLRNLNPWFLALGLLMVVLRVVFGGLRLYYVAGGQLSLQGSMRGQLSWDFFSNVTPSAIGGAPVAAFYIARDSDRRVGEATAYVLFCMLLDQLWFAFSIPVLFIASLFLEVFPTALGSIGTWVLVAVFLGMLCWTVLFAYAVLVRIDVLERLANRLFSLKWLRRFQERVQIEMQQLRRRATIFRARPPRFFLKGFLLTAGAWFSRYFTLLFIVWSVYTEMDKVLFFFRTMGMMIGSLVMPTPGGSGGIEGLYALFIGPLIPQAVLAPTLVTWRFMAYYIFIAVGVFLTMHQVRKSAGRTADADRKEATSTATDE